MDSAATRNARGSSRNRGRQEGCAGGHGRPYRNQWIALAVVVLIGLALRGAYLAHILNAPDFTAPTLDPQLNDYWARALVTGDWTPPPDADDPGIRSTPYGRPPGYPYVLALIYRLSGGSYLAPRVLQMAVGLVNVLLLFVLGRAVFGRAVGLIAAALMAVYWAFIYFEGELNSPVFVVFLALLLLHVMRLWRANAGVGWGLAAGVVLGLMALIRPNALLVGGAVVLWFGWVALRRRLGWRRFVLSGAVFVLGCAAAIAPAIIRNYAVAREFILVSYYGGVNAYIGNNPRATGTSPKIPDLREIAGLDDWNCFNYPRVVRGLGRTLGNKDMTFGQASRYFYGRALDFVAHHPLEAAALTGRKALLFWGPKEISDSKVVHFEKRYAPALRYLPGFPLALAGFIVGVALWLRDRRQGTDDDGGARFDVALAAVLFILAYFASVLPFFISGRYRVPVVPFLLLFAAYAVWRVFEFARTRAFRSAGLWAGIGVILFALAHVQWVPYTPELPGWRLQRAVAYAATGDSAHAIEELERALAVDPDYAQAHLRLGVELAKLERHDEALAHYGQAVRLSPESALAHNNLGFELARRGRWQEAQTHYRKAVELDPASTLAHTNLGHLLADRGQLSQAARHFQAVLEIDPADPHAHYNLGNLYARLGDNHKALEHFHSALENNPRDPNVPNNLGLLLATLKRYDEAIEYYRQALEIDPDYAKAYFNLGNVFGEMGRLDEAVEHLEKALEINPGFTQARQNLEAVRAVWSRR